MRGEDETNFSTKDQWLLNNAVPLTLDDVSGRLAPVPIRSAASRTERSYRTSELRSVNRPHAKKQLPDPLILLITSDPQCTKIA